MDNFNDAKRPVSLEKRRGRVVMKFGGASLANVERMKDAAKLIMDRRRSVDQVVVVVSAMNNFTDDLLDLTSSISMEPEETDTVLAAGEQIAAGLMALALQTQGISARSFLANQIPILTDGCAGNAQILSVGTENLERTLRIGQIPIIAGFQGIDHGGRIVTLGRGGSDKTAVAVAAALKADVCEFYKDVSGIYSADPNHNSHARKFDFVSFEQMTWLARNGAQVLHEQAAHMAGRLQVPLYVRSAFTNDEGTWIGIDQTENEEMYG